MQIDATTATLLAGAIGGISSGATAVIILFITKRSEERRHLRELAMKGAIENWKYVSKSAEDVREPRLPLDVYMVHMFKLAEALSAGRLTADNLPTKLREAQELTRIAIAEAVRYSSDVGEQKT